MNTNDNLTELFRVVLIAAAIIWLIFSILEGLEK